MAFDQKRRGFGQVQLFNSPTDGIRKGIEAEEERLAGFFKKNVLVEYEYP